MTLLTAAFAVQNIKSGCVYPFAGAGQTAEHVSVQAFLLVTYISCLSKEALYDACFFYEAVHLDPFSFFDGVANSNLSRIAHLGACI